MNPVRLQTLNTMSSTYKVILLVLPLVLLCVLVFFAIPLLRGTTTTLISQPLQRLQQRQTQQPSVPTVIYGYLPYWTASSYTPIPLVTTVSFFSLEILTDGSLFNQKTSGSRYVQQGILEKLKENRLQNQSIELTITLFDQETIPLFFQSDSLQSAFFEDFDAIVCGDTVDGFNIDIEYNGVVDQQLQSQVTSFFKRLHSKTTNCPSPKTLSLAAYGDAGDGNRLTNLRSLSPYVDTVVMMAYDYHQRSSPKAGPIAPLYGTSDNLWEADIMSDLKSYTDAVSADKILLGIPLYGYEWSVTQVDQESPFTLPNTGKTLTLNQVDKIIKQHSPLIRWNSAAMSPYFWYQDGSVMKMVYFEDQRSLHAKMVLVTQAGLRGIAIWALGYDTKLSVLQSVFPD